MSQTLEEKWLSLLTLRRHHVFKLVNYRHNQAQIDPLPAFQPFFQLGFLQILNEEGCEINYHTGNWLLKCEINSRVGIIYPRQPQQDGIFLPRIACQRAKLIYLLCVIAGLKTKGRIIQASAAGQPSQLQQKSCCLRLRACCLRQTRPFVVICVMINLSKY